MASYDAYGNKKFSVGDAVMTRASPAYNPDTGDVVGNNSPRVSSNKIVWNNWLPRVFYSHLATETELNYADFLTALTAWELINVGADPAQYTKFSLGVSAGGRAMPAYRLGPIGRKHFVVTSVLHGNEHDGMRGLLTAMQMLRGDDFLKFRSEWTILWVPMLNPDGYSANTRNCESVGPNGQTVNLDADFDYFWTEYEEASTESKGAMPESEIEVVNFLGYWRTGNAGGPVQFGFLLDFHANSSPGARYQTRDVLLQKLTAPGPISFSIPGSELEVDIDAHIWKMARTLQTLRYRAEPSTSLNVKTRAVRSRSVPRMHSYFSSQGVTSLVVEEVHVGTSTTCLETYKSASDFRLDYVLATAFALTQELWEAEDAILLEPAGTNVLTGARLDQWAAAAVAPTGWTPNRLVVSREPFIKGMVETGDRFYPIGESVQLTPALADVLQVATEYTRAANPRLFQVAVLTPDDKSLYLMSLHGVAEVAGTLTRNEVFGPGAVSTGVNQYIDFLGGGLSGASAVTKVTRVRVDTGGIISEADVGNLNTARKLHACCDNYWGDPGAGNFKAWVFGGFNAAWARLTSIESWAPATTTATTMAAVLPTALANSTAVYYPTTNKVYVFGGSSAITTVDTIYEYDITGDTIALHATPMTVGLKNAAGAYSPIDGKIYIIGGEVAAGTMSTKIYSFDPATGTYAEETGIVTTLDNEDVQDGTTRPWAVSIGRNCACLIRLDSDDAGQLIVPGGRLTSTAGALTDGIYSLDLKTFVIGLSQYVNAGKLMPNTELVNTEMSEFYGDAFANLAGWDNSAGAWSATGGAAVGVSGVTGWLVCLTTPTSVNQRLLLNLEMLGGGAMPDFKFALRSGYGGGALTDGYVVTYTYDGANAIWYLYRYNASVATSLATAVNVTADALKQVSGAAWREFEFRVEELNPVHLVVSFNGYTLFDAYDFGAARITSVGAVGVYGGSA